MVIRSDNRPELSLAMESREQVEQAAAEWIARRDTGSWSEADAAALQSWLAGSPSRRAAYYRLNAAWHEAGRLRALHTAGLSRDESDVAVDHMDRAVSGTQHRRWALALAAGLLLAIAGALLVFDDQIFHPNRYTTVIGGLQAVPMPDGSRITLNTDSQLRISLTENERRIDLDRGEAFFEVAKDPNRPFVVRAGNRRIIAVGTQFSVRREGDDVRVIVTEGTVRLEPAAASTTPALLPAGTIARAEADNVLVQQQPIPEIEQRLTWRSGILTFRDTPLADAVAEFNRYNTRKIVIEDPAIAALQVGGIFRSTNLDPFVHLLEQGFPIHATPDGDRIILTATPH